MHFVHVLRTQETQCEPRVIVRASLLRSCRVSQTMKRIPARLFHRGECLHSPPHTTQRSLKITRAISILSIFPQPRGKPLNGRGLSEARQTRTPRKQKPPGKKKYYSDALHGEIERIWDAAVTPVAMEQGIVVADTYKDCKAETDFSPCVRFDIGNPLL